MLNMVAYLINLHSNTSLDTKCTCLVYFECMFVYFILASITYPYSYHMGVMKGSGYNNAPVSICPSSYPGIVSNVSIVLICFFYVVVTGGQDKAS